MKGILILILLTIAAVGKTFCQQSDSTGTAVLDDIEEAIDLFEIEDSEAEPEQMAEILLELAADPVNLNRAGLNRLMQVPGIDIKIARAVIEYREQVKPFESVQELQAVSHIGEVTLEKIRSYVTPGDGIELGKDLYTDYRYWTHNGRMEFISRYRRDLQNSRGYREQPEAGGYTGSPVSYYQRFRYRSNHLSLNLTQEKDAGEALDDFKDFDYISGHVALQNNGNLQSLVIGDYSLSFGQGLVLWDGGIFGKGSDVTGTSYRNGRGIKPYTSAQETNFYRGAAVSYGNKIKASVFASSRSHTASEISRDSTLFPTSSGYHRTLNERSRKNNLQQRLGGGRLRVEFPVGIIGVTGYYSDFSKYIVNRSGVWSKFDFSGRNHAVVGLDYSLIAGPLLMFGEVAGSKNGGAGLLSGINSTIGRNTHLTAVYRNYQKDYQSVMGNGFGESSGNPQNEEGIYLGLKHDFNRWLSVSVFIDQFWFPAPRYGTRQPTKGYDWLGRVDVSLFDKANLYFQVRGETKEDEFVTTSELGRMERPLGKSSRTGVRANLEYRVNPQVRMRSRIEFIYGRKAGADAEKGFLLYQDIRFLLAKKLRMDSRLTVFDTDSFATRLYQFENDLLYLFSGKSLFNRGQRIYLLLNYEPFDFIDVWAKYGITIYEDQQTIGSGLNEIEGNKRSELGIQVRLNF